MIIWLLIVALVTVYIYIEWYPADVEQSILKHQASAPTVRSPGESGVYRSTDTPHSSPLLHEILDKHFRGFTIEKLWEPNHFRIFDSPAVGTVHRVTEFAFHVHQLGTLLSHRKAKTVVVALPVGVEALAMTFACGLYNIDVVFTEFEDSEAAKKAAAADLVVSTPLSVSNVEPEEYPVTKPSTISFYSTENGLQTFTAREIGLSIASQLRSLGHRMWCRKDTVLIFPTCQHPYALLMQLTALSSKAKLVFVDHTLSDPFKIVAATKPTVLVTDDVALQSLQRHLDDFNTLQWLRYGWSKMALVRGRLTTPLYKEFGHLRLIHSVNVAGVTLSTKEANDVRIMTGCQLILAFRVPSLFMPLFQTGYGDYRSTETNTSLRGPPAPGLEVKVVGPKNRGRLYVNYQDEWVDAKVNVYLRGDGCAVV